MKLLLMTALLAFQFATTSCSKKELPSEQLLGSTGLGSDSGIGNPNDKVCREHPEYCGGSELPPPEEEPGDEGAKEDPPLNGTEIPMTFIYLKSGGTSLSANPMADAEKTIARLKQKYNYNGEQLVDFKIKEAKEVEDTQYFNTTCNNIGAVANKYPSPDSMTMVFVNSLASGCLGVSYLWVFPSMNQSVTMARYDAAYQNPQQAEVVDHEFGHSFGLHHVANTYQGSTPGTGIKGFNDWLNMESVNQNRRCTENFDYYIHNGGNNTAATAGGVTWNSFENIMYPSAAPRQNPPSFFTDGYNVAMPKAMKCWNEFAQKDI
ncbi:MAG: hypothetical protein H6621_07075 [Halobacteriovoraceae bacterium]|nr:hypothetical protein [Halobacteriovoraceae bacterium]